MSIETKDDNMNISIEKQIVINRFPFPYEIQDYIKGFVFDDKVMSETKKQKKKLINSLNSSCHIIDDENWAYYNLEIRFHAINCLQCGDFIFTGSIIEEPLECRCRPQMG